MNAFDGILLLFLAAFMVLGFRRGFILEVAGIFGSIAAFGVARVEYGDVRTMLEGFLPHSPWLTIVAYVFVFLLIWGAIIIVARKIRSLVHLMMLGWLDRLGGMAIGIVQGALAAELLVYLARHAPNSGLRHLETHSALGHVFVAAEPFFIHLFPSVPR